MPVEITFLRHGETEGNLAGIWQGHGDTPLTADGRRQVAQLGARAAHHPFDLVVSSDLGRAVATASAVADRFELDAGFREADIGDWEGRTTSEIRAKFDGEMESMVAGEDVRIGGGEAYSEFSGRIEDALAKLLTRLDGDERVLVVSHGGAIGSIVRGTLWGGEPRRDRISRLANTSMTTMRISDDGARQMTVFNDATHIGPPSPNGTRVWLVRHGQSEGNVSHRWQGTTDGELTGEGRAQAALLSGLSLPLDTLYSSTLRRARDTAGALAGSLGVPVTERADLGEMSFGAWEDKTAAEIIAAWPDEWTAVEEGRDVPRGATGETFIGTGERIRSAVAEIAADHPDAEIGVVTHSAAMRAYVALLLDLDFTTRHRLGGTANTAFCRVSMAGAAPLVEAYNLTPHLEG